MNEFDEFAASLNLAQHALIQKVNGVVFKGAQNVKKRMKQEMESSTHFRGVSRSIDFETATDAHGITATIGPRHGSGEPGNLANVAYFGTSRGGGTVDLMKPMEEEAPRFERSLKEVLDGLI